MATRVPRSVQKLNKTFVEKNHNHAAVVRALAYRLDAHMRYVYRFMLLLVFLTARAADNENATDASFLLSYRIARTSKSHTGFNKTMYDRNCQLRTR